MLPAVLKSTRLLRNKAILNYSLSSYKTNLLTETQCRFLNTSFVKLTEANVETATEAANVETATEPAKVRSEPTTEAADSTKSQAELDSDEVMKLVNPATKRCLEEQGIKMLFEVQSSTFLKACNGNDLIVQAMTGSGKTLSFVLPIMEIINHNKAIHDKEFEENRDTRGGPVSSAKYLVLSPTRELSNQTNDVFRGFNGRSMAIYGGSPKAQMQQNLKRIKPLILSATPGRLIDMVEDGSLGLNNIEVLVIDEVDTMLDMGFLNDVEDILSFIKKNQEKPPQVLLYSATCPSWVKNTSKNFLSKNLEHIKLTSQKQAIGGMSSTISHYAVPVENIDNQGHIAAVVKYLIEENAVHVTHNSKTLVFGKTRKLVNNIASALPDAKTLSSDNSQSERLHYLDQFRKNAVRTLVATDVASRGLDIPNVDIVVTIADSRHESSIEDYIHRSGRTGRAGEKGVAIYIYEDRSGSQRSYLNELSRTTDIKFKKLDLPNLPELKVEYGFNRQDFGRGQSRGRGRNFGGDGFEDRRNRDFPGHRSGGSYQGRYGSDRTGSYEARAEYRNRAGGYGNRS